ncbi:MAG: hypothetical protein KBE09_03075 [Candidatus Pacebacteria bacterium]|nr:hypothetical protein [Candidatus Paceibacterota bacterium]
MESNIKSSFIPDDAARLGNSQRFTPGGGSGMFDLAALLSTVMLVASLALGVGVFLYVQFLQSSLASKREQLVRAQEAFEPTLIQELTRLDDRMQAAQEILNKHAAPSLIFTLLEQLTLETVSFKNFSYNTQAEAPEVKLQGLAQSVNSIALQADLLGKHAAISSPIFSNITREAEGVRFDLAATVIPAAIRYANTLSGRALPIDQAAQGQGTVPVPQEPEEGVPLFAP